MRSNLTTLKRLVPILNWLPQYQRTWGAENCYTTTLEAILAFSREAVDGFTGDEVTSVIDWIDSRADIISAAAQQASPEHKTQMDQLLAKLADICDQIEAK